MSAFSEVDHMIIQPSELQPSAEELQPSESGGKVLNERQIRQWREEGYLLIDGIFNQETVAQALQDLQTIQKDRGEGLELGDGLLEFPTGYTGLDGIPLCEKLISAAKELLNEPEVRLVQAETWKKTGVSSDNHDKYSNQDQRIHMDYPNHTLLHPPNWYQPEAVACIVYMSQVEDAGGATRVVPRVPSDASADGEEDDLYRWPYTNMPGFGALPWINDRKSAEAHIAEVDPAMHQFREAVYAREREIYYRPGTVLLYRYDLWHRGTPLKPSGVRFVQNLVYKRPRCDWLNHWNQGAAKSMYRSDQYVEKLIARSSVTQRNCLGIPLPGDSYWTPEMVDAVQRRYGPMGMDISPYQQAPHNA